MKLRLGLVLTLLLLGFSPASGVADAQQNLVKRLDKGDVVELRSALAGARRASAKLSSLSAVLLSKVDQEGFEDIEGLANRIGFVSSRLDLLWADLHSFVDEGAESNDKAVLVLAASGRVNSGTLSEMLLEFREEGAVLLAQHSIGGDSEEAIPKTVESFLEELKDLKQQINEIQKEIDGNIALKALGLFTGISSTLSDIETLIELIIEILGSPLPWDQISEVLTLGGLLGGLILLDEPPPVSPTDPL